MSADYTGTQPNPYEESAGSATDPQAKPPSVEPLHVLARRYADRVVQLEHLEERLRNLAGEVDRARGAAAAAYDQLRRRMGVSP